MEFGALITKGSHECVCARVSCIDAIGMAHGREEDHGYCDDPKHPHDGSPSSQDGVMLVSGRIPPRAHSEGL